MGTQHMDIWQQCLVLIRGKVNAQTYSTWFEPIKPLQYHSGELTIQVPSLFFMEYLEEKYVQVLRSSLAEVTQNNNIHLLYKVIVDQGAKAKNNPIIPASSYNTQANGNSQQKSVFTPNSLQQIPIHSQLNKNYSFDNFIEGNCNRLVRSTGNTVAMTPGSNAFNPMFIYGGSGLGKTHVSQAIGLKALELDSSLKVLYVTTNQFKTQYTDSVRNNKQNDFLNYYQMMDILILDDIHELAGLEKTQNTFFHIFNHLHQSGKQLILTSDRPVIELKGVSERLLTRFKWSLIAELSMPDFDTRVNILKHKAKRDGLDIDLKILEYLAQHLAHSIRELEGALISLMAQSLHNNKKIDLALAATIVEQLTGGKQTPQITLDLIVNLVIKSLNIKKEDLFSKSRKREVALARQIVMYLAKTYTHESLANIGRFLGNRDHATVSYGYRTVCDLLQTDKLFASKLKQIQVHLSRA